MINTDNVGDFVLKEYDDGFAIVYCNKQYNEEETEIFSVNGLSPEAVEKSRPLLKKLTDLAIQSFTIGLHAGLNCFSLGSNQPLVGVVQ